MNNQEQIETDIIYFTSEHLKMASGFREKKIYETAFRAATDLVIGYWQNGTCINEAIRNVESIASMIDGTASLKKVEDAAKKKKTSSKKKKKKSKS